VKRLHSFRRLLVHQRLGGKAFRASQPAPAGLGGPAGESSRPWRYPRDRRDDGREEGFRQRGSTGRTWREEKANRLPSWVEVLWRLFVTDEQSAEGIYSRLLVGRDPPAAVGTFAAAEDLPADGGAGVEHVDMPAPAVRAFQAALVRRASHCTGRASHSGQGRCGRGSPAFRSSRWTRPSSLALLEVRKSHAPAFHLGPRSWSSGSPGVKVVILAIVTCN